RLQQGHDPGHVSDQVFERLDVALLREAALVELDVPQLAVDSVLAHTPEHEVDKPPKENDGCRTERHSGQGDGTAPRVAKDVTEAQLQIDAHMMLLQSEAATAAPPSVHSQRPLCAAGATPAAARPASLACGAATCSGSRRPGATVSAHPQPDWSGHPTTSGTHSAARPGAARAVE